MAKDIYKWWSRKALKNEILKLKLTYNELFDSLLRSQEAYGALRKYTEIVKEANVNLKASNEALRRQLNERSYTRIEEQIVDLEDQIADLEDRITKWREDYICLENLKDYEIKELQEQIEKMKKCLKGVVYMANSGLYVKNTLAFARLIAEAEDFLKELSE